MGGFELAGLGSWILMGILAGILGRFLLPGSDKMGCIATVLTGIVGAIVGGFIATALGFGGVSGFDLYSVIIATLGAILFLVLLRLIRSRRGKTR